MMIGKISSISLYITVLLVSPAALHGQETIVDSSGVVSVDSLALSARVSERADSLMRPILSPVRRPNLPLILCY